MPFSRCEPECKVDPFDVEIGAHLDPPGNLELFDNTKKCMGQGGRRSRVDFKADQQFSIIFEERLPNF